MSFIPYIQPIHDIKNNICIGGEILARQILPGNKLLMPSEFIQKIHNRNGLSILTKEIIREIEKWFSKSIQMLPDNFILSINIPPSLVTQQWLLTALHHLMISSNRKIRLIVELTETAPFPIECPVFYKSLSCIRESGIKIALDDFGTGYSNLCLLQKIKVDYIKIPRNFIAHMTICSISLEIINCIISLCEKTGIDIIAEGIENIEHETIIRNKGIHLAQGFWYGKPMSKEDFLNYAVHFGLMGR
ncbi:EAL domain-containing protein [Salmonella enterica subsp. enterica]|nr:EAL domain-containing protein [Salmonella enterica]EBY0806355.1 EAL domain-containing protein [Salmonella enterica subsp. enterica serovar Berlin]ECF3780410.1 EAL domain-containing protein [Salmonella enterica subsp. enterica serovar Oslo]EDR2105591.1 EAL domain-containing protein [Salmonella enterica subsp. enterica]EDW0612957.1 EAL domain-containing protein [Salmonella enterica subsp. enterica serovar Ball]EGZ4377868.1 EAL domain-containing protein [Salmonella enterica subsp. enterica ser